jgi:RimJ/RimL family protein N-acetyltransferase
MKTNLEVMDGKLTYPTKEGCPIDGGLFSLLNLKANVAENGGFIFYDREKTDNLVCKIAYVEKRGKTELCYETELPYQSKGYMTEAMEYTLRWLRENTAEREVWLLIDKNNVKSLQIAQRFNFVPSGCTLGTQEWHCLDLEK